MGFGLLHIADRSGLTGPMDELPAQEVLDRVTAFLPEYNDWAEQRDLAAISDTFEENSTFRATLPFTPGGLQTAIEASWYFDELLIEDPIENIAKLSDIVTTEQRYPIEVSVSEEWKHI